MSAARWPPFVLGSLLLLAAACTTPPPSPLKPDSAIVGVRVALADPLGGAEHDAQSVFFVRMEADGQFAKGQVIQSNYASDGYAFLVNAEPGTYVAVAAMETATSGGGARVGGSFHAGASQSVPMLTYFPEAVIGHTSVEVKPATAAFMGEYVLGQHTEFERADELQRYYHHALQPDQESQTGVALNSSGSKAYCGELKAEDRSANALSRFVTAVGPALDDAGWSRALARPVQPVGN
jgi:hypothetical protein